MGGEKVSPSAAVLLNKLSIKPSELGIPTEAGLPHMFGNAFRNVASLVADIDFTFKEVEEVKKFLADPDAYAAANPVAAAPAASAGGGAPKAEAKKVVEEEEEE